MESRMKCYYCDAENGKHLDGCPDSAANLADPHARTIAFISFDYGNGCYLPGWTPNCEINERSRELGEAALNRFHLKRDGIDEAPFPDPGSGWVFGSVVA